MNERITSLWQDYETHLFTCTHCGVQTLGEDCIHDFEASDLVVPLDCPNCERRVALLTIKATEEEIKEFAAMGYKSAVKHLNKPKRLYEAWPDFTVGESDTDTASRLAHSIEFMFDENLGEDAVQFMQMVAFGIQVASHETPYIVESEGDESKYYQMIRGSNGEYYSELAAPEAAGKEPNQDSPNYHREYAADADRYDIAADVAKGWFRYSK